MEEVATVILELHQGGGGHADTTCCQHQAEATTSDRERDGGWDGRRIKVWFSGDERNTVTSSSHLPDHGRHHLTGKEHTELGESLREEQTHHREHQHQATTQVWHRKTTTNIVYDRAQQHHPLSWEYDIIPAFIAVCESLTQATNGLHASHIGRWPRGWEKALQGYFILLLTKMIHSV